VDGDVLVYAGDDFGLVVGVIDDGFVQAAVALSAIDRQILDAERVEHVGHEVAAARRLIHRVARRRHGLGRDLQRARNGSLQSLLRRGRDRVGRDRRRNRGGGADEAGAFQEIAAAGIAQIAAFRHGVLPGMA